MKRLGLLIPPLVLALAFLAKSKTAKAENTKVLYALGYLVSNDDYASELLAYLDTVGEVQKMEFDGNSVKIHWISSNKPPAIGNGYKLYFEKIL